MARGTVLFGVYELLERIGSGGMGQVYQARHLQLGELRAIKVMRPELAERPEVLKLFVSEAKALLEVRDDAVVRCHDLLSDSDGRVYLVMELVDGPTLSERVRTGGALGEPEIWALGARIAEGLAAAHARGVVHRDLSPDNVILPDGRPENAKLIDFGVAKMLYTASVFEGFKGKFGFASPEQLGLFGGEIDARSDLYSLGLVLAFAAVGETLPMGTTIADAVELRRHRPPLPRSLPRALRTAIEPLLAPSPKDRPASARGLFTQRPSERSWSRRLLRVALPVALALGVAVGVIVVRRTTRGTLPPAPPVTVPAAPPVAVPAAPPASTPQAPAVTPPVDPYDRVRDALLAIHGSAYSGRARVWAAPAEVSLGSSYELHFQASCNCEALLFSISHDPESIALLYPNAFEPAQRFSTGQEIALPSTSAYALQATGTPGRDTLVLLLSTAAFPFPPAGAQAWEATRSQPEQVADLAKLLEDDVSDSARGDLRIVP